MIQKIIKKIRYELQFNNTHYYHRISERFFKTAYKKLLQRKIRRLPPIIVDNENALLTLATLANKKNFYESVAALYSFCFWERNIHIHYHEDGTLTNEDISFLKKIFPGIVVFRRSEQNLKVKDYLLSKKLPKCAGLRDVFFLSIKLFDMVLEKKTPYVLHIDSDVLFFSKPYEILDIAQKKQLNGCYNKDVITAFNTFTDSVIAKYIPVPILKSFNSGLIMHNFDEPFFDLIERVMEGEPWATESWHLEQTLLGMYATVKGGFQELPKHYDLAKKERDMGNTITSEHYVHGGGYQFQKDFIYKLYPAYTK